ncbi:MAG: hypothetical protein M0P71_17460 [Melioribacteraceae bacterium]|nr:hypothetical protein [Melioribacteraceae bacterium]
MKKKFSYNDYKLKKARESEKAFENIKGIWTFLGYIIGYKSKELFVLIILILSAIVILQYIHFDFSLFRVTR